MNLDMTPIVGLPAVVISAVLVVAALIAVQRRKDSVPRIVIAIVLAAIFLGVMWDWVGGFRQCRLIGGSFTYCASR